MCVKHQRLTDQVESIVNLLTAQFLVAEGDYTIGNEIHRRTLDMKRPKAPPSAKPIPPAMIDLVRHDSMPACI
jgi:hypothetical protein